MPSKQQAPQPLGKFSRAVITGASGFIGHALVAYLQGLGLDVIKIGRHPAAGTHVLDIASPQALDRFLHEGTVLFHLAAHADVGASVLDPAKNFHSNVITTFEVLESVRRTGCRLIFPSTASIYDSANTLPLKESALIKPTSPYGASKVACEAYCAAYFRSFQSDIVTARLFSVYGPSMDRFVIFDIVRKIQDNPARIEIRGDGEQIRDYLYIDDVVRGLVLLAESGKSGEEYNLAAGIPIRLSDLVLQIATLMGNSGIQLIPTGDASPGDIPRWYADVSKLAALGFVPQVSLHEGLLRTISSLAGSRSR